MHISAPMPGVLQGMFKLLMKLIQFPFVKTHLTFAVFVEQLFIFIGGVEH